MHCSRMYSAVKEYLHLLLERLTDMRLAPPLLAAAGLIIVLGQAHAQEPVLGVAAIDLQNSFFVRMKEAGDVAAKDYGVTTIWQSAEASLEKEVAIIENY